MTIHRNPSPRAGRRGPIAALIAAAAAATCVLYAAPSDAGETSAVQAYSFGVRLQALSAHHTDADGSTTGVTVTSAYDGYLNTEHFSARGLERLAIGGGTGGLEGVLLGDLTLGGRAELARGHAIAFRGGLRGWYDGNDTLLWSSFELPQTELGYQYLNGDTVIEIMPRSGLILDGRYAPGHEAVRKLGGRIEAGGRAAVITPVIRADTTFMYVPSASTATPGGLSVIEGRICGQINVFLFCADGRFMSGAVAVKGVGYPTATTTVFGALVAVGAVKKK